jgi:hypothetical protein
LILVALVGLKRALVRGAGACDAGTACRLDLQPTWAGPCFSSGGGAIGSGGGRYFLVTDGVGAAEAICIDIRITR